MRLVALDVRRLPGIDDPFSLAPGPGVNLVVGPNASGKSSLARAVRDLLWPQRHGGGPRWLRAVFADDAGELTATCDGPAPLWSRGGAAADGPVLPPAHLADCYRLTAAHLLGRTNDLDRDLAAAIRTEMTGGYDLDRLLRELDKPPLRALGARERELREARAAAAAVERAQAELAGRRDSLQELHERVTRAEAAARRRDALTARREALAAGRVRDEARAALAAFPAVMPAVRADDPATFAHLHQTLAARRRRSAEADAEARELARRRAELAVPGDLDPAAFLDRLAVLVDACRDAAHAADLAGERQATLSRSLQAAGAAADQESEAAVLDTLHRTLAALDTTLAALTAAGAEAAAEAPGRARPLALLAGAGLLAVLAALPFVTATPARLAAAGGALLLGALGVADFIARTRRRAQAEQRRAMATAAAEAQARRDDLAARAADLAEAEAAAAETRRRLADDLAAVGAACAAWNLPAPATAAAAGAALADLRGRVQRHADLAARLERAHRDRDEAARDADAAAAQLAALLERLQLPAGTAEAAPVQALAEQLPAWRRADEACRRAEASCANLEHEAARRAAAAGTADLVAEGADLDAAIAAAEAEAALAPDLREQLGSLRQELRTADAGHALAEALAREQEAAGALADLRGEALDRLAEAALAQELRERHDTLAAPPRLREANRLLGEFTRHRYALVLGGGDEAGGFAAIDRADDRRLGLGELSDGTRAQVLLAVRVAFVAGAERGARPPLFLDEALTTSDPARLAAVAASLGRLVAATGRQVFYLTSQPADVGAWRGALADAGLPEPAVLDLAVARRAGTAAGPQQLAPVPVPAVPGPDGRDAAAYGLLLGVAALDLGRPWQEADTFHLAAPDLELAHRLRGAGLDRAGPLAAVLEKLVPMGVADAAAQARLGRGLQVLRALAAAWRVGRPGPVTIADVDASGAVSDVFRPRVLELLKETGWDAARFLEAAAAGGIPRFQARKLEALRDHLADAGRLDERPPLGPDQLVTEVLLRLAAAPPTEARTSVQEVRALVLQLLQATPGGALAASPPSSGSGPTG